MLNLISQRLTEAVDASFADRYGMHHGRLDVKFRDVDSLRAVSNFENIEINGADWESIHVWDRNVSLLEAAPGRCCSNISRCLN